MSLVLFCDVCLFAHSDLWKQSNKNNQIFRSSTNIQYEIHKSDIENLFNHIHMWQTVNVLLRNVKKRLQTWNITSVEKL